MQEIVHLREPRSKTYLRGHDDDGNTLLRTVIARLPIHRPDPEGNGLVDIAPEWDGLVLGGMPYGLELDADRIGFTHTEGGVVSRAWLDMRGERTEDGVRVWWLGVRPDLDVCLVPSATNVALHFGLHSERALRSFAIYYDGPAPGIPRNVGRDNINNVETGRPDADMYRELEVVSTLVEHPHKALVVTWTGRVKAVDPETRRKRWTTDVAYPVRVT